MNRRILLLTVVVAALSTMAYCINADESDEADPDLARDLELLQGSWELIHGGDATGRPTTRSIKTIEGNREALQRFNTQTGDKTHEHSVEFQLTKSGNVRVFTFYPVGGSPGNGASFVYKIDKHNFWDVPGLLRGDEYRNYQRDPTVWHWRRIGEGGEAGEGNRLPEQADN